jgi:hypothetical protein
MKLFEKIKSFFKDDSAVKSEKFIITQNSCPHCASRGMFVFNDISIISNTIKKVKSKDQCQSEPVED